MQPNYNMFVYRVDFGNQIITNNYKRSFKMKILKIYSMKLAMVILLLVGVNQHSAIAQDSIAFRAYPPDMSTLALGDNMGYNGDAFSYQGATLNYKLINPPTSDAEINSKTGEFKLLAGTIGNYNYTIRAFDINNESIYSEIIVRTKVINCWSTIEGNITINDQEPKNLLRGSVDIFKKTIDTIKIEKSTYIDQNGKFTARVDEGNYILRFNGYLGNQQVTAWYNAKTDMDDADEVSTSCNNTSSITWNIDYVNTSGYFISMEQLTDYPYNFITKGETFEKKIEYTTNPEDEEVVFSLSNEEHFSLTGPNNDILKLNSTEPGFYNVGITARMKEYNQVSSSQIVRIWVTECDKLNELTVNLIDKETGERVEGYITANLIKLDSNVNDSIYFSRTVDNTSTQNGKFTYNVDKGEYSLEAYLGVNVDGKLTNYRYIYKFDEPTNNNLNVEGEIIEMDCEDQTLTWEIRVPEEVKSYNVSGYVTDENTNGPVQYAQIELVGKNKLTDDISKMYAYTNDNGYYSVRVLNNAIYSVSARSIYDTLDFKQYIREYWEETNNPLEATILELNDNVENINFTLTERADYKNKLSGTVYDEDDNGVESASVVIYLIEPTAFDDIKYKYWSASTSTDSVGKFVFENLIPGDYIIYTFAYSREYKPGYYSAGSDYLVLSWLDATNIEVEETGSFGDVELRLAPLKPIISNKGLSGKVGRMKDVSQGTSIELDPLNGVEVIVTNSDDKVINYSHSHNGGKFDLTNLEYGVLNVYFDKVGFRMMHEQITISNDNSGVVLDVGMEKLSTTEVTPYKELSASIYPNPSYGYVTIFGEFKLGRYLAKITNVSGNTVKIIPIELTEKKISINLSELSSGQYSIQLIGDKVRYLSNISIIK